MGKTVKIKQIFFAALVILPTQTCFAGLTPLPNIPNDCGPRYEIFRQHLINSELKENAIRAWKNEALKGFKNTLQKNNLDKSVSTDELQTLLGPVLENRIVEHGGFIDIASCWFSIHAKQDFDFAGHKQAIHLINQEKISSMGSQPLDWVAYSWCAKNWNSILGSLRKKTKHSIPDFRPLLYCTDDKN